SPEASAEASIAPSVSPEASVEASIAPSVSPEVSVEPSAEPLPGMPVITISAAQDAILAGETAVWNYEITDAVNAVYTVSCDGAVVSEGTIEVPSGSISIAECAPGSLTAAITAQNELGKVSASASIRIAEKLQLDISCSALSCFDGDRVSFALTSSGGEAPVAYKITVRQGGAVTQEYNEFRDIIEVEAQSGGSVSALALEVEAVDALGNTFGASCEIPVAVNKRERPSAWADSARTELSGDWTKDLVRVAKTQLGYRESEINFIVRKDGSRQGYTRYGDWYGLPYEEWCAMFASFCLNYADIPESEIPRNAGCARWINDLSSRGLYAKDGEYTPAAGDLVFFDWEHDGHSDHVGIVAEVSDTSITTIEGNSGRSVRMCSYSINDSDIMGYGMVSRAYANLHPADDEGEEAPAVDDAQDNEPVHIEMWIEEGEEASTINMCAVLNGVNEEDFNWKWQRAQSPDGEWQDITDTMGLECALPLNEENYFGYYRICGDYGVPMAAVYSLRALPEATEAAPAAITSAPESPSLRGIGVSGSQMTIDVYFINTANNLLNEYAAEYTASSSYSNFVDTGALFDELKTGAAGAELRNGSYAAAYLGTSAENKDKEAKYLRFYWSTIYYSQTETYAAPYISSGGNSDFEDYALYIHYTPAASDVKVTFYNRKDFGDSDRVREPHSFGSGKTLAEAGVALPETAPVDPRGMGRPFAGWFFTNDAGEEVELTEENIATVAFEADTAVYAVYSDAATYTVTFLDSEGGSVFEENEYTIAGGETLGSLFEYGELPWPPMDEYGEVEYRWYYRDENGDELPADPEMTVNSDLQIYAKQVGMYLVYIYDIDPDGTPVSPDPENGVESDDINILVPEGDIVADYFYDVFQDGTEYADINAWYSMDDEGNLHPFDPASAMPTHDLYLYTYSYRLGLLRDDDASGETLEIVAREATPLNAADFIVDDVYYRTYK
ncbi:MAG: CHAP domain-containing protein, partial [Clostridia bacterium]|nr:CHAP domain-containing protein [Clostridia bacterium]